jgi:hypothetical protein
VNDHESIPSRTAEPRLPSTGSGGVGTGLPSDTSPDAAEVRRAILRRMSIDQKATRISELSEALRDTMIAGVRFRHPEYTEAEGRWATIRHLLGDELFAAAFPSAPRLPFDSGANPR